MTNKISVDSFSMYDQLLNSPSLSSEVGKIREQFKDQMNDGEWPDEYYEALDSLMKEAISQLYKYSQSED